MKLKILVHSLISITLLFMQTTAMGNPLVSNTPAAAITGVGKDEAKHIFSTAGFFTIPQSPRTVANFNPGWRFFKGDMVGAERVDFDDSNWEAANLPHGLEILGENESGCRNYQGPAWYRKKFDLPNTSPQRKFYLYFEAVMGKCTVWINGQKITEHFGGYLPFAVDISPYLSQNGRGNMVAVRADNSDDDSYPPGKAQNNLDFTYLGGIYRDVYLIQASPVHVTLPALSQTVAGGGVFIGTQDVNNSDAKLEVRTEVLNETEATRNLILRTTLESTDGKELLHVENRMMLAPKKPVQISQPMEAKNVHLWHPDDPYLHFVRTEIIENGKVVDSFKTRYGIRLFEMRGPSGLYINKKPVNTKLIGVNRHQDYPYIGNALPKSGQWRDVKILREGGSRIIRAAHYPMAPAFYDACDELGMLVTSANPGWQFYNFNNPLFKQRLCDDTRALVRCDRNRPSILFWETVINERRDQPTETLKEMNRIAHEENPFPGMYTVADIEEAQRGGFDCYYGGSKTVNTFAREFGDGDQVDNWSSQNSMNRVKREWGEIPMLGQAKILPPKLDVICKTDPIYLGGTLWCGIDHQRGYHPDPFWGGLLDSFRIPRYGYYFYKSQYDPDYKVPGIETGPMVFIVNELTQVSPSDVVVYSNCEEVRLSWLGKIIDTRKPDAEYKALSHPPFTFTNVFDFSEIKKNWRQKTDQIEMVAEGLIGGKVVVTQVKKYAARTKGVRIALADEGIGLTADGSDFVPIRAFIVDTKGIPKVLASDYVYFKVEGSGEIIGGLFNHGNPVKTEFGVATALLRATTMPGIIKVKAYVNGLASDEITITSSIPSIPLVFDADYASKTKAPNKDAIIFQTPQSIDSPNDNQTLREENLRLKHELTGREQDLMEIRNKLKPQP